jgi:hypothetical protein
LEGASKEGDGAPELEVVVDVGVGSAEDFDTTLVERVVVAATHAHRPPRIAALQQPLQAALLRNLLEGAPLFLILHLQEHALMLQL